MVTVARVVPFAVRMVVQVWTDAPLGLICDRPSVSAGVGVRRLSRAGVDAPVSILENPLTVSAGPTRWVALETYIHFRAIAHEAEDVDVNDVGAALEEIELAILGFREVAPQAGGRIVAYRLLGDRLSAPSDTHGEETAGIAAWVGEFELGRILLE